MSSKAEPTRDDAGASSRHGERRDSASLHAGPRLSAGIQSSPLQGRALQLVRLQRSAGNRAVSRLVAAKSAALVQRKPNDIDKTYKIDLIDGEVQQPEGERESVSVATPINKVSGALWAKPAVDLKGGHLYKRELGGADDYTNVVPWHADIEKDYTDKFENVYSKGWKANGKGKSQKKGAESWNLNVKASFTETAAADVEKHLPAASPPPEGKEDPVHRKRFIDLTRWSIDTIPASASASIEKEGGGAKKIEWTAEAPKGKTAVGVNDDAGSLRQRYDYAHSKPEFEGPLDGDAWIKTVGDKLAEGADH